MQLTASMFKKDNNYFLLNLQADFLRIPELKKLISFLQFKIFLSQYHQIMQARLPDPRFEEFEQQFDSSGNPIGFKIPGNDFLFRYDSYGGWTDQKGNIYDKDGYLVDDQFADQSQEGSGNQDSVDDDQIVDQFQQMLMEQQEGIIRKPKPQKKVQQSTPANSNQIDYDAQTKKYIQKLKNKQQLRQGISPLIFIFFKMRSNLYERIVPQAQKKQNQNQRNQIVKVIKGKIEQKRKRLLASNQWLQGQFTLEYSGTSLDENVYDRYWYGWVKVSHENYNETVQKMRKSSQFAILKSKTFYALKSKFFLKGKMKQTIGELKQSISKVDANNAVLIKLNNLPEQFPLSFVVDLIQLSGGYLQDIQDINIIDDFCADLIVKHRSASILTNIQGYCHDQKQFVWIQVQDTKRAFKFNEWFNIQVDAPYKVPIRQINDTLALQYSKQQIVKVYDKQQKTFRLVGNQGIIRKLLMFRGQSLNIVRIVRWQKKE